MTRAAGRPGRTPVAIVTRMVASDRPQSLQASLVSVTAAMAAAQRFSHSARAARNAEESGALPEWKAIAAASAACSAVSMVPAMAGCWAAIVGHRFPIKLSPYTAPSRPNAWP